MLADFIYRSIKYTKRHLFRDPAYFLSYGINYFKKGYVPHISYYDYSDIPRLLEEGKSFIRLGDGDVYTLTGGGQPYQQYDEKLSEKLFSLISEYSDDSGYVLCLNKRPLEKSNKELKKLNIFNCWLPTKIYYNLYFNKQAKYHDAAMFYYADTIPKYFEKYLLDKSIVIAANKGNIDKFKANKNIPFLNIKYIETPEVNAFSKYSSIKDLILNHVNDEQGKKVVVLAAFGPASKVLAYDLFNKVQIIDIGYGVGVAYTEKGLDYQLP